MKTYFFLLVLCISVTAKADYLVVSRSATIKSTPASNGSIIDRVNEDEVLILLEDSQTNGYFKVKHPDRNTEGWIYRTLVRRREGAIPGMPGTFPLPTGSDLVVNVIDVGPGLCSIIKLPDGRYIIYDVGHWRGEGMSVYQQIATVIPPGSPIELMVLSHTDSDHIGAAAPVLKNYRVKKLLYTGYEKSMITPQNDQPSGTYQRLLDGIASVNYPLEEINLNRRDSVITPGVTLNFGTVRAIFLCGFGKPLNEWNLGANDYSKRINSVSIVMRLEYAGKSILFCGDAVGRFDNNPVDDLQATEKFLVEKASEFLDTDVLIAPHHGADNGSSKAFIAATTPKYVIFSAGHDFEHPRQTAADRYIAAGVKIGDMFRTDRGDDERENGKPDKEWALGRIDSCKDSYGDDDVIITIAPGAEPRVVHRNADALCQEEVNE